MSDGTDNGSDERADAKSGGHASEERTDRDGAGRADREGEDLPAAVADEAERLTRLARAATDPDERAAYESDRDDLVAEYGFRARVREDDTGETLVVHPAEWVEDGTVRPGRVTDTDRAVERSLSGPGDPERWAEVDEHNRALAAEVRADHGDVHGDTAAALATFMSNHYAKPVERATADELREFSEEYFPRNAWPSDEQRAALEESIAVVFETAGRALPGER